jgi:hypothetical protein
MGNDDAKINGILRDGFPIYAEKDMDGSYPTNLYKWYHIGTTADFQQLSIIITPNTAYLGSRFYILKSEVTMVQKEHLLNKFIILLFCQHI